MKFSTRTTYGLRAMISLAQNWHQGTLSLASISKNQNISLGYLERLFAMLKKAKLVKAEKGASGGYVLSRSPGKINILNIVKSLEGDLSLFHCLSEDGKIKCSVKCKCGVTDVLVRVQESLNHTLKKMKLSDLI